MSSPPTSHSSATPPSVAELDRRSLLIERIETVGLRAPLKRTYAGSVYSMRNRCTIVTRVYTREGIVGEVYTGDTDDEQDRIVGIIHDELAPRLIGQSAVDPEGCWLKMAPSTNDILRDRGLALQAIAGVDSAIWDTFGKALGLPLHRVWGSVRDSLPIVVIGGYYHVPPDEIPDLMSRYRNLSLGGCKFKVGGAAPAADADRVRRAREAAGPAATLMIDANQGYDRAEAVDLGRRVADLDIRWFEEPCRWANDRRWMRDVRYQTGLAVCAGQSEPTLAGLRDLMIDGAIDVSNFDASWSGGPTVWRKAAGLAAAFGVEVGHHEEPQISAHLLASVSHGTYVECFEPERDPFFWNLFASRGAIANGRYAVPSGPGFGIVLDKEYADHHIVTRIVTTRDGRSVPVQN